ncbi:hypothetical protein HMPREF1634_07045 [Tissierellia bacterium S7-1-4]|uniref:hypothetical protein n=1 Tax=Ezakiella coagulans TaxID=46507 RepID=UPI0005102A4B|nr:hypothetical protein [Ezakiella coagulans]KGF06877.1 hypothetical protein HMPREF1634_07045 [Tissierellia bacterium S7-1-4]UQK60075.1 hypothetical protein M1R54_05835 [Ezakiella coagulans]
MERNTGSEKTNFKQWIVVGVLVLAIALIMYFMVVTKRKTETYNKNLSANITGLLNANKTYYIKDYDKEDDSSYGVSKFKSVVLLGYDNVKPGVVQKVSEFGETKDEDYLFVAERKGKKEISVLLKKPVVLSHEVTTDLSTSSVTETNNLVSNLKRQIEKELISSKDQESIFEDTKSILKTYLEALGYESVAITEK